jgi:predicted DCC family thiol-disulfide oxidoreductase YuxK
MLYDGDCRLCSTGVDVALALDTKRALRFAALQSPAGRALLALSGRSPDDISSVVLVTRDGAAVKSEAVLGIAKLLGVAPAALAALAAPLPRRARDGAYDAVADNRYGLFGRLGERRLTKGGGDDDPRRWLVE